MCLGYEVVLTLVPKSGFQNSSGSAFNEFLPLEDADMKETDDGPVTELAETDPSTLTPSTPVKKRASRKKIVKVSPVQASVDVKEEEASNMDTTLESSVMALASSVTPKASPKKAAKEAIVVTMVHGDVLILSGDNFEVFLLCL